MEERRRYREDEKRKKRAAEGTIISNEKKSIGEKGAGGKEQSKEGRFEEIKENLEKENLALIVNCVVIVSGKKCQYISSVPLLMLL